MVRGFALRCRRKQLGLSLVETVVAVSIVAVLATLISAVIVRSKAGARTTACLQNLRQIGVATEMYASDFDNCFPPYGTHLPSPVLIEGGLVDPVATARLWKESLARYGVEETQFFCPDDPYTNPEVSKSLIPNRPLAHQAGGAERLVTSYRVELSVVFIVIGHSRSAIERPSETPYLLDGLVEYKENTPYYNHGVRMNGLNVDGSVKSYSNTHNFPPAIGPRP